MKDKIDEILKEYKEQLIMWIHGEGVFPEREKFTTALVQLYSAGEEVSEQADIPFKCDKCGFEMHYTISEDEEDEFGPVDLTDVKPDKLTRPTVSEDEIEEVFDKYSLTEQETYGVLGWDEFKAAIKELNR